MNCKHSKPACRPCRAMWQRNWYARKKAGALTIHAVPIFKLDWPAPRIN